MIWSAPPSTRKRSLTADISDWYSRRSSTDPCWSSRHSCWPWSSTQSGLVRVRRSGNFQKKNADHRQPKRENRKYYHRHPSVVGRLVAPSSPLCIDRHYVRGSIGRDRCGFLCFDRSNPGRGIGPRHGSARRLSSRLSASLRRRGCLGSGRLSRRYWPGRSWHRMQPCKPVPM